MAKHVTFMMSELVEVMFENDPEGKAWATFDPDSIPAESISNFVSTKPFLYGLRDCIVANDTKIPFITSDNPAVIVNRFHVQKQGQEFGGAGLICSGVMLVLPLTPRLLFVSYDHGVYGVDLKKGGTLHARRPKDVEALNALQILRASENLYYDSTDHCNYVNGLVGHYGCRRPAAWHKWIFALEHEVAGSSESKYYRVVKNSAEFRTGNGLFNSKSVSVDPGIWCSLFSIRNKPKIFDTKSEAGLVRSEELLNLRSLLREPDIPITIPRSK